MNKVIDNAPFNAFLQDVFESEELSINLIIVNMGHSYGKPTIRHMPTRPPARRGKVTPVRITPDDDLLSRKKGKR
jgi:hypothetical protein